MALLKAARGAQYELLSEFPFNFDDTMVNTAGVTTDFKTVATPAFDVVNLPQGAVVVGGELVVETAYAGPTVATVSVGDSASAARYLAATSLLSAARTAFTPTGYRSDGENLRLTFNITVAAATAGKATVRVVYVIPGKINEVVTN